MVTVNERIVEEILPEVVERFLHKGKDYQNISLFLGSKGQFADINRKFWKLYRALWLEQSLEDEPVNEVAEDMIGHLLLLLYFQKHPAEVKQWSPNN